MSNRTDISNILIVTLVAVLIWYWAAGETRDALELSIPVSFQVSEGAEGGEWLVDPAEAQVSVTVSGSRRAVRRADDSLEAVTIQLPPDVDKQTLDMARVLQDHPEVEAFGITIESPAPATIDVTVDRVVSSTATVTPLLPGVRELKSLEFIPSEVTVQMPERFRRNLPEELTVETVVDRRAIESLGEGLLHKLSNVPVRLLNAENVPDVIISPSRVRVEFMIESQERVTDLESVRIQILSPPEEDEYSVALDPKQLRNVTVTAHRDVITRIQSGDAVVLAVLHLKSTEKDRQISSKRISGFVAVMPDGRTERVEATVAGSEELPIIGLTITGGAAE